MLQIVATRSREYLAMDMLNHVITDAFAHDPRLSRADEAGSLFRSQLRGGCATSMTRNSFGFPVAPGADGCEAADA